MSFTEVGAALLAEYDFAPADAGEARGFALMKEVGFK